ncbi:MAG: hypothetical protein ABIG89_03500 [Candidatus Woesearchaeota archaeon]
MILNALFETINMINVEKIYSKRQSSGNSRNRNSRNGIGNNTRNSLDNMELKTSASVISKKKNNKKTERQNIEKRNTSAIKRSDEFTIRLDDSTIIEIIDDDKSTDDGSIDIQVKNEEDRKDNDHTADDGYTAVIHFQQYQQLLNQYKQLLESYLKSNSNVFKAGYNYNSDDKHGREFQWGQEVTDYHEIKNTVRKIKMNLLLGGWHNAVSQDEKDRYKFWKYVSKFNKVMADVIETSVSSGG